MRRSSISSAVTAAVVGVLILCALGIWQVQRLHQKESLLADLAARQAAEPVSVASLVDDANQAADLEFRKVKFIANYQPGADLYLIATFDGRPAWEVVTPALTDDGIMVLVDRGVVPDELRATLPAAGAGSIERVGIVRRHALGRGMFAPDNDVAGDRWYWWDVPAMLGTVKVPAGVRVAPFVVQLLPEPDEKAWPRPLAPDTGLSNNHLQYAITWFSLAAVLLVVTGLYVRKEMRQAGT